MSPAIILDGIGINGEFLSDFIAEKIADITLVERLILNLQNEGFTKIYLISNNKNNFQLTNISRPIEIKTVSFEEIEKLNEDLLVFQNNVVLNKKQLFEILDLSKESETNIVFKGKNEFTGVSLIRKDFLNELFLDNKINDVLIKKADIIDSLDPPLLLAKSQIGTYDGRDFLFSHISKNVSGWVSKNINSKISIPVSKLLIKTNLHPNTITFFVGCLGISCGYFYAINQYQLEQLFFSYLQYLIDVMENLQGLS